MSSNSTFNDNKGTFMLAYDVKAGKLYFGKDGQWLNGNSGLTGGNPSVGTGLLTALYPAYNKVKHSIHLYLHIAVGKICRLILAKTFSSTT